MTDQIFRARVTERVDARDKVTGDANYPGDLTPPNLLFGRVLFSGQPHAPGRSVGTYPRARRMPRRWLDR